MSDAIRLALEVKSQHAGFALRLGLELSLSDSLKLQLANVRGVFFPLVDGGNCQFQGLR